MHGFNHIEMAPAESVSCHHYNEESAIQTWQYFQFNWYEKG